MTVKMSAALPDDHTQNGLTAITSDLVRDPETIHYAIVAVDCCRLTTDTDTGDTVPTARIRHIEPLTGAAATDATRLLHQAQADRTGHPALPLTTPDGADLVDIDGVLIDD